MNKVNEFKDMLELNKLETVPVFRKLSSKIGIEVQ